MTRRVYKAFDRFRDSFGQAHLEVFDFTKEEITLKYDEIKNLPDGEYATRADDRLRAMMEFKVWQDPQDCKYIIIYIKNGEIARMLDVELDIYDAELAYLRFL